MGKTCVCCNKPNNPFNGDPIHLDENRIICSKCAQPIQSDLTDIYFVKNSNEFAPLRDRILQNCNKFYSPEVTACIEKIAVQRYNSTIRPTNNDAPSSTHFHASPSYKVGPKIEGIASFFTFLGVISSIILAILIGSIDSDLTWVGVIIGLLGCIMAWLSNLLLHGFGRLVSSSERIVELLSKKQ